MTSRIYQLIMTIFSCLFFFLISRLTTSYKTWLNPDHKHIETLNSGQSLRALNYYSVSLNYNYESQKSF